MRAGHLLLLAIGIACLALAQGSASAPYLLSSEDVAYECVPDTEIDQMYKAKEVGEEEAYRCKEFCKRSLPVLRCPLALGGRRRDTTASPALREFSDGACMAESRMMYSTWKRWTKKSWKKILRQPKKAARPRH
jgi:hypothetical protein